MEVEPGPGEIFINGINGLLFMKMAERGKYLTLPLHQARLESLFSLGQVIMYCMIRPFLEARSYPVNCISRGQKGSAPLST